MKNLSIVFFFALFAITSAYAQSAKPTDLTSNNLLTSPDFGGNPCYAGWEIEVVGVACNAGAEYVWLNHNNRAGDPAVKQTLNNLTVGAEYEIVVGWRGGDHGPIHGVRGARNVFAIDIDNQEIHRLTTGPNFTDWMINDKLASESSYGKLTFTATAASHTIRFRGEVGADGDVLIDWVQIKSSKIDACAAIQKLIDDVKAQKLSKGDEQSLISNLPSAIKVLGKGETASAIDKVTSFLGKLDTNKGLKAGPLAQLKADAQAILDALKSGNYSC